MSRPPYKRYGNMPDLFQVEGLFLDSKSGAFKLEDSRLRSAEALERLYLVAAIAILYGTTQGKPTCKLLACAPLVDPHWRRGISYSLDGTAVAQGRSPQGALPAHADSAPPTRPTAMFCLSSS